jgi:hypothetical protein
VKKQEREGEAGKGKGEGSGGRVREGGRGGMRDFSDGAHSPCRAYVLSSQSPPIQEPDSFGGGNKWIKMRDRNRERDKSQINSKTCPKSKTQEKRGSISNVEACHFFSVKMLFPPGSVGYMVTLIPSCFSEK